MKVNMLRMIEIMEQDGNPALVQALKNLVSDGRVRVRRERVVDQSTGEVSYELIYQATPPVRSPPCSETAKRDG